MMHTVGVGLVGYGYWGPNLARNFSQQPGCKLLCVCEQRKDRAELAARTYPGAKVVQDYEALLGHKGIDVVLIATPVSAHFPLAKAALLAGKDVLIEKPLTSTVAEAEELIRISKEQQRILGVDHTFLYTGAVQKIKEVIDKGELGEILYIDSVRINLGLFQPDVNVIFDLAPHDLSIMGYLLNKEPSMVQAMGARHASVAQEHMAYLHLEFDDGPIAHFHLSWLSPVKIRRTVIGGTEKMIVYDDLESSEKVKIYDKGIVVTAHDVDAIYKTRIDYRTGDMVAPKLTHQEALSSEAEHFLACVRQRTAPISDGPAGLKVVRIIEAAQRSMQNGGSPIRLEAQ
jgi:predicted dehydrogenase